MAQPTLYRTRWSDRSLEELAELCHQRYRLVVGVSANELRIDGIRVVATSYGRSILIAYRRPRRVSKYKWRKLLRVLRCATDPSPRPIGVSRV